MKLFGLTFILIAIALIAACHKQATTTNQSPTTSGTPDEFAAVRATYIQKCGSCHGETGGGGTATVDGKKIKCPSLSGGHALHHPDDDFVKQISKGGDGMPAFGDKLSAQQINDLIHFIRKDLQAGNAAQTTPAANK